MTHTDTTPEAAAIHLAIQQRMTGAERMALAIELSQAVREIQLEGLRSRHPDWSERELVRGLMRSLYRPEELPPDLR